MEIKGWNWRHGALSLAAALCLGGAATLSAAQTAAPANLPASVSDAFRVKATGVDFNVTGTQTCTRVTVTVTATITGVDDVDEGQDQVVFELWDDGELKDSETVTVAVGATEAVSVTLAFDGAYATDVDGVGILVYDNSDGLSFNLDPFIPVDACRGAATPVPTLSGLSLMLMGTGLAGLGVASVRRRKKTPQA